MVLALPRGGVPVAREIARALGCRLGLVRVRKIAVPGRRELAMGALALIGGDVTVHAHPVVLRQQEVAQDTFEAARAREEAHLRAAGGGLPGVELAGAHVVLVDDGLATGSTMLAAVAAVRARQPASVLVAVPVGAPAAVAAVTAVADRLVCPWVPRRFVAVSLAYRDFSQLDDGDAVLR